jgi:hypothetical protein
MMAVPDRVRPPEIVLSEAQLRNRRRRNIAIGLSIGVLVVLFYAITIVKLGPGILRPDMP